MLLRDPNQQGLLIGTGMLFLNYSAGVTVIPMQAFNLFGTTPGEIGLLYSATSIIAVVVTPIAGKCADRYGRLAMIFPSAAVMAAGCAGIAFAGDWHRFVAAYTLWSVGEAVLSPAISAYAADIAPKSHTGSALALSKQSQDLVFFLSPLLLGALYDACPGPAAMLGTAALSLAGGAAFRRLSREVPLPAAPGKAQRPGS